MQMRKVTTSQVVHQNSTTLAQEYQSLEISEACSLNLAPEMYFIKETK